jgi:hypothetical protein
VWALEGYISSSGGFAELPCIIFKILKAFQFDKMIRAHIKIFVKAFDCTQAADPAYYALVRRERSLLNRKQLCGVKDFGKFWTKKAF